MDQDDRPARHDVVHLAARRRAKQRTEGAYSGYDHDYLRGNMGQVVVLDVPFHLDEHEPELETPIEFEDIIHTDLAAGSTWERLAELQEAVATKVAAELAADGVPVVVSGCCTTALGTVAGMQRAGEDPAVIWFDAHADLQTPQTSASGYPGGMPLRQLIGGADRTSAERLGLRAVREDDVVLVDARSLDPAESEFLATSAIRHVQVGDIAGLRLPRGPYYLHVDFDVLEPTDVPGVRFPVPGGPTADELWSALEVVLATGEVAAVGLACTWRRNRKPGRAVSIVAGNVRDRAHR
jgi:arginase